MRSGPEAHAEICRRPWAGFPLIHPLYFARRRFYERFRYSNQRLAEDQELLFRAHATAVFANVPEILLGYREERINLRRILSSRKAFATSVSSFLLKSRRPGLALRVALGQVVRVPADVVAVGTGLHYRVLRHRAKQISGTESRRWQDTWTLVCHSVGCENGRADPEAFARR
jgi:hypothetical protein